MIVGHIGGGAVGAGYEIEKSLRFRATASAYLSRTFGTPTDQNVWTLSKWVERGELGRAGMHLFAAQGSGATSTALLFGSGGALDILRLVNSSAGALSSTAAFRDPSAHYHIVVRYDNTDCTVWINGGVVISGTLNMIGINYSGRNHKIGCNGYAAGSQTFDGYLSEIHFIDGQALTPDSFGEFNADGVWVPKKYTGTYGTNGFYLPFNDGADLTELCRDRSGNGNDWAANNISLTAGATYDWMDDTPTNNFAVLNPLASLGTVVLSNANNTAVINGNSLTKSSIPIVNGQRVYFEDTIDDNSSPYIGIVSISDYSVKYAPDNGIGINNVGEIYTANTNTGIDGLPNFSNGSVVGVAVDMVEKKIWWSLNGQWYSADAAAESAISIADVEAGSRGYSFAYDAVYAYVGSITTSGGVTRNFGQRPFAYPPPTGFKALCTKNRPLGGSITTSGSFTGNANADGPFVWLNGDPVSMTINGNAVTWGTHVDRTAGGFKVRTSSASYNASGTNNYVVTITGNLFGDEIYAPNTAKGNP